MLNYAKKIVIAIFALAVLATVILFQSTPMAIGGTAEGCEVTYKAKCAICHAVDGSGNTVNGKNMKLRDLRSSDVQKQPDAKLYELVAVGKGKMPGYEKTLGRDKVNELVAYMRELAKKR